MNTKDEAVKHVEEILCDLYELENFFTEWEPHKVGAKIHGINDSLKSIQNWLKSN